MADPKQVDFGVIDDFSSPGIPPNSDLVIYGGTAGPFMIISENRFLNCPECHARYELTDYTEGSMCRRLVENKVCGGRVVRCGKPIEINYLKEVSRALRFEKNGHPQSDQRGAMLWEKWFTRQGAELRLKAIMEGGGNVQGAVK